MSGFQPPNYPIVNFLVRRGALLAIVLSLCPPLIGLYLTVIGLGWLYVAGGVVIGAVLYVVVKSYVELVCIIADMLLPK